MSQNTQKVIIADIPFVNSTKNAFLKEHIVPSINKGQKCFIVTANPEIVMQAVEDASFKQVLHDADFVVPDGIGVLLAAKWKKQPLQERIAGSDLMNDMLEVANEEQASCYFLGADEETNEQAVKNIRKLYPTIQVAGRHHGYFDIGDQDVLADVVEAAPDFVFVALGSPKQENWIRQSLESFSKGVFMGVGGCLDIYAGNVKRAPNFWIKLNIEWLYRLLQQPFRWKRMLPIIRFLFLAIRGKV